MAQIHSSIKHLALIVSPERSPIMEISLASPLQFCLKQVLPFAFSFLDDALLLLLPRLGLHMDGLQWLSPALFCGTVLYWIGRFLYNHYRAPLTYSAHTSIG